MSKSKQSFTKDRQLDDANYKDYLYYYSKN